MAKTELGNLHLDLDIQRADAYSPDVPEGQVMQSSPAAGEPLNKGDTVVLTVSKGPETKPLTVPNFVTMHIDDAAQQAEALGLTVGEHQYEFSDKPEGTVIGQSIQQIEGAIGEPGLAQLLAKGKQQHQLWHRKRNALLFLPHLLNLRRFAHGIPPGKGQHGQARNGKRRAEIPRKKHRQRRGEIG